MNKVADLIGKAKLVTTTNKNYGNLDTANLRRAFEMQQSGTVVGKMVVLEGFD